MAEYKILISGPMGSGKSTALASVSEMPPVRTEVRNTARDESDKETTTVAMDFGQVRISDDEVLRLYGTPGQARFAFMREILLRGALGVVLLIDARRPDPVADLRDFIAGFGLPRAGLPFVVGVTKLDLAEAPEAITARLIEHLDSLAAPVPCFGCDVRQRSQVLSLLDVLLAVIEAEDG